MTEKLKFNIGDKVIFTKDVISYSSKRLDGGLDIIYAKKGEIGVIVDCIDLAVSSDNAPSVIFFCEEDDIELYISELQEQTAECKKDNQTLLLIPKAESKNLATQIGGGHYKRCKIQPIEYIEANKLDFIEGSVVKYVTRHRYKNGAEDIKKAIHLLELKLELEYGLVLKGDTTHEE